MFESVFVEIGIIIILALIISGVMRLLKQPLIIGYIITGILAGPYFLGIVKSTEMITTLAHFGVVFLLFIAGLSLNPSVMKSAGKISLITGLGQVLFTTVVGFFISRLLGFTEIASMYIAIALTFSSTIIIIKLLSDKGDVDTLYGRISVGFLIVQDIVAILILMMISPLTIGGMTAETILMGVGVLVVLALFSIFALPRIVKQAARSQEFLLMFSVGWLLLLSVVFGFLNFSIEIGALLAGISLSVSPYHYEIKSRMNTLRDFFILFFFVLLGSQMVFTDMSGFLLPIVLLSVFILVGNPIIVMVLMGFFKYTKRTGFLAGLTVAQISEFSLILVALGVSLGQIPAEILSLVTAVGLITIFGSTYMIMYSNALYSRISKHLSFFERRGKKVDEHIYHKGKKYDIVLFGYNRLGFNLLEQIKEMGKKFLVIDFNPQTITELAKKGYECKYGDANDIEMLNTLSFSDTRMVISTIPDMDTNMMLMKKVRDSNKKTVVILVCHRIEDALELYEKGATYVIMPYFLGGEYASDLLKKNGTRLQDFLKEREEHMKHLKLRYRMKHEHPRAESLR